jgi:hypothetical protein
VTAVDRDARAVEATRFGAVANGLEDRVQVQGSLGYDDVVDGAFDLIVSNIPAKIGPAALAHVVLDASHHTAPGGLVATVVVARLASAVAGLLADPAVELLETHPSRAYSAFVHRFHGVPATANPEAGFERGAYRRGRATFRAGALAWEAEVSFDIPEFDTLAHGTLAALDLATGEPAGLPGRVVIAGTGQGHLALGLRAAGAGELRLVDRDLLALRTSARNLAGQGGPPPEQIHAGRLRSEHLDGAALAVVELSEREPVAVTAAVLGAALDGLDPAAPVVLHGRTSDVQRVVELLPRHGARLTVGERRRMAGHSAVRARKSATPPR